VDLAEADLASSTLDEGNAILVWNPRATGVWLRPRLAPALVSVARARS
jgi:hypothetical protein